VSVESGAFASLRLWESLRVAKERCASDVHIATGLVPAIRVGGELAFLGSSPVTSAEIGEMLRLAMDQGQRTRLAHDADITVTVDYPDIGTLRLHASTTDAGTSLAFRLLPNEVPTLDSLRLPEIVRQLLDKTHGLLIFAGPTGSGKSTSLAGAIRYLSAMGKRRIICVEDPIEFRYRGKESLVTQRQVGRDVANCADAVLASLRSDPDVILIGEMRDAGTMRAALLAAETGHLVLTTLHTGEAPQTVDRIVDAFDAAEQRAVRSTLANVLLGVLCQRLVRCRTVRTRRVAAEVLVTNDAVRALIRDGKSHQLRNVISTGRDLGMQSLEQHLCDLLTSREIEIEEALRQTNRGEELLALLRGVTG